MRYIIIGDGIAGASAAEKLREKDERADIKVLTDDSEPLYNRIMLKSYMKGSLPLQYTRVHDADWYDKRDIDLHLDEKVEDVDLENSIVHTVREDYEYDKLLVASGGSPRRLPCDEDYDNVNYMWTMDDAKQVKQAAQDSEKSVIIGGGLLGIDFAVTYAENDSETYYLIRGENWWRRGLDKKGAEIIHQKLEEKGVKLVTETEVTNFETDQGEVVAAVTDSGERFECDSVAVAVGQEPNSDFINVEKNERGMIKTDKFLQTSNEDVYAAGNMVDFYSPVFERRMVNGSWDNSEAMGETAVDNMLGNQNKFDFVNTYGVGHFDVQFLAIGDWTGQTVSRKYNENGYRRLFFDGDRIIGAVMIGKTDGQKKIKEAIKNKKRLDKDKFLKL